MPLGSVELGLTWCAIGFVAVALITVSRSGREPLATLGNTLPGFTAISIGLLIPAMLTAGPFPLARWVHHASVGVLGFFVFVGGYFQTEAAVKRALGASVASLRETYGRWHTLTEIIPASAAVGVLLSGLVLIYLNPTTNSLRHGWMFWLVVSFSVFLCDGLLFYRPAVMSLYQEECSGRSFPRSPWVLRELQLMLHFVSFPFVFALGAYRPDLPQPLLAAVATVEQLSVAFGESIAAAIAALLVVLVVGAILFCARRIGAFRGSVDTRIVATSIDASRDFE